MARRALPEEALTSSIIGAFLEVYRTLDFGFHEFLYVTALAQELSLRGHRVEREALVDVRFKGTSIGQQRMDLLVDHRIVVEVKATERLSPTARRQLFGYLRATRLQVGLLLHFGPEPKFLRVDAPPRRWSAAP